MVRIRFFASVLLLIFLLCRLMKRGVFGERGCEGKGRGGREQFDTSVFPKSVADLWTGLSPYL
jgi:hypothetical protein